MSTWVNVLDYAATVIPVTTVDKQVDKIDENYKPLDETDELVWKCCTCFSFMLVLCSVLTASR